MSDKELVLTILTQIDQALAKILYRTRRIRSSHAFTDTPRGMERLDGICMLFIAIGESLKQIDKITENRLLERYPQIDWKGLKGFRDIISHHYFDVDAEQVFWVCRHDLKPLVKTIKQMIDDLRRQGRQG